MNYHTILLCLWVCLDSCLSVRFDDFQDFLRNHNKNLATTTKQPMKKPFIFPGSMKHPFESSGMWDEGSGEDNFFTTTTLPPTTLPRTRMTCCEIGKLAGQNNFHCNPNNYGSHMLERNRNRGYSNFKRNQPSNRHAFTQVKQFDKCISGQVRQLAMEFQVCCKQANREQLHQQRRDEMMLELPINVNENNKPSRRVFHIERDNGKPQETPAILSVQVAENDRQKDRTSTHENRWLQ